MAAIHVNREYPVVDINTVMNGAEPPQAWLGKGATVQALLQYCRHQLKHEAKVPEDLVKYTNLTWRTDAGQHMGQITAAHIRVIVDLNKSHFGYVTLYKQLPDGQELPMLCVSATIKGLGAHPTYDPSGRPLDVPGNSGTNDRDHRRGRQHRPLDSGGFPMNSVPQVLPSLEDIV